ncbi:ABC transporter ATP-binding protein [Spirochaetota bacterium]
MKTVVNIDNLSKKFGDFIAVNNITLSVNKGEIFGFLGPNGAGKSTTIKMLCGILMPTGGKGSVLGFDIVSEQDKIKSNIGYMSQKFSLFGDLTVMENLSFFGSIYGLSDRMLKKRIKVVLEMSGIDKRKDELVINLPVGIKQRLALGCAILHDPDILFLDEPTSGVDPIMRRIFWEMIYSFSKAGKTIFVTTHYLDEAEHCNRIALIISGEIIALDSPEQLKKSLEYDVFTIKVDNFIEIFDKISRVDFIEEAAIFGSDIHILCGKEVSTAKEIKKLFGKMKISSYKLEKIMPSLEDVFVTSARKYDKIML